jgi:hypothetical protein
MKKNILLPFSFFVDVFRIVTLLNDADFSYQPDLGDSINEIRSSLEKHIQDKFAAHKRHELFSKYKTSNPGSVDREAFRKAYLDEASIHPNWISTNEIQI